MSITFFAENSPVIGFAVTNRAGGREEFGLSDYEAARQRFLAVRDHGAVLAGSRPSGDEWADYYDLHNPTLEHISAETAPDVNMGSGGAATVLGLLGVAVDRNTEVCGEMDAHDFLSRVKRAQAPCLQGAAVSSRATNRPPIDGGRREDYFPSNLDMLRELAEWAVEHGRTSVYWG